MAGTSKSETQSLSTSQWSSEEEEKALNAAAAREIRLELEALNSSPPQGQTSLQHESPERGRPPAGTGQSYDSPDSLTRENSPLAPPSAPFARRSLSPHPYPEMMSPGAASHSYAPPHGFGGPNSATFGQPQESHFAARSLGLSPGPVYHSSRLQPGSSPLSGLSITDNRLPSNNGSSNFPGGLSPGARTISAAAFKKTRNMSLDNLKGLPGSPNPTLGGGPRIFSASALPSSSHSHILPSQPPDNRLSQGSEYDYIDAYLQPNSPHRSEFVEEGGYQTGHFSTDLEDSPLR